MMNSVVKRTQIEKNIPYVPGKSEHIKIDNGLNILRVIITHNVGSLTGGSTGTLVTNAIINNLRLNINGKDWVTLKGDADASAAPWHVKLLKELNKLRNGFPEADEIFNLPLPKAVRKGHVAFLDFDFNSLANIQTAGGDRTAYTGTISIAVQNVDQVPLRRTELLQNPGKIIYGINTGDAIREFIDPTEAGFTAKTLIGVVEDDGSEDDTAITKLTLKRGRETLEEGSLAELRNDVEAVSKVAVSAGFFIMRINKPIVSSQLQLIAEKNVAGTNVELHWLLTSIRVL